jgi:hypothetical protein
MSGAFKVRLKGRGVMDSPETKIEGANVKRRGVFLGALAGVAALVVGRASPAAAEDGAPLLLGTKNVATNQTDLEFISVRAQSIPIASPAFSARQGESVAMLGSAPVDTSRFPVGNGGMPLNNAAVAAVSNGNIGVFGNAGPSGVGVWGASENFIGSWGASLEGVGVLGQTYPGDIEQPHESVYPAAGVFGIGGRAPGTWGLSTSGPGAWGQSNTGPGVLGQTGKSAALPAVQYPAAGVLGIGSEDQVGVWGLSAAGIGSWGQSDSGQGVLGQLGNSPAAAIQYPHAGVVGITNVPALDRAGTWGLATGVGIGAWGQSNMGVGVSGESNHIGAWFRKGTVPFDMTTLESAALHTTAMGNDMSGCFRAQFGVAVEAETEQGGIAIRAVGRIQSNLVGLMNIAKNSETQFVACIDANTMSHVVITPRNDLGAMVSFVEVMPGRGFTVHFDRRTRSAGSFSWSVVEALPAGA